MFLPSQLQQSITNLTGNVVLVLTQQGLSRKVTIAALTTEIDDHLITYLDTEDSINQKVLTQWQTPLTTIETQATLKAPNTHTHTQTEIGLSHVANLAPPNLPISTAQQAALDLKLDLGEVVMPELPIDEPDW